MTTDDFTLYSREEYFRELIAEAQKAKPKDRILISSMGFNSNVPLVHDLTKALGQAAQRGVEIRVVLDAFMFMLEDKIIPGPLLFNRKLHHRLMWPPFRSWHASLQEMESNGVHCHITNWPSHILSLPQKGRSHIKTAIINDKIFIGGCNLTSSEQIDIMMSWHDQPAADWLYEKFMDIAQKGQVRTTLQDKDIQRKLDDNTQLFIDSGVPGQSLIYDQALDFIDAAREWILIACQFFPGGRTARHLLAAHKQGVKVRIIYNHPIKHLAEAPAHHLYNWREKTSLPAEFFQDQLPKSLPPLHAKVLSTEQGIMIGSHNYVTQGVSLGTAEIAVKRYDPKLALQTIRCLANQIV